MDNEKMARFIAEQRKIKGMTQKELAEKLSVTDKAVSKWERGLSCPDISLLSTLSNILEVSLSELLNGEKSRISETADAEEIVGTTLQYAHTVTKSKSKIIRSLFAVSISALFLLAIIVCLICNFAITGYLTWGWFPISSLIYLWLIVMPTIIWSKNGVYISLILISFLTIPFLFVLETVIGIKGVIMPIGASVSIVSIAYLWVVYLLIGRTKWPKYIAVAITVIAALPLSFAINYIVSQHTGKPITDIWDILTYFILTIISALILGYGYIKYKHRK